MHGEASSPLAPLGGSFLDVTTITQPFVDSFFESPGTDKLGSEVGARVRVGKSAECAGWIDIDKPDLHLNWNPSVQLGVHQAEVELTTPALDKGLPLKYSKGRTLDFSTVVQLI